MNITVFGATGMVGRRVVDQALAAGHQVLAFGRDVDALIDKDNRNNSLTAMRGYIFNEADIAKALVGANAVISVIGGAIDGTDRSRSLGMKHIIHEMDQAGIQRIIALGGAGVLNASEDRYVLDTPGYPSTLKAVGQEHMLAYLFLQASTLDWTFVCAGAIVDEEGRGDYVTNADYAPAEGGTTVYAGDLVDFMLKELNANKYLRHRVGIVSGASTK